MSATDTNHDILVEAEMLAACIADIARASFGNGGMSESEAVLIEHAARSIAHMLERAQREAS